MASAPQSVMMNVEQMEELLTMLVANGQVTVTEAD